MLGLRMLNVAAVASLLLLSACGEDDPETTETAAPGATGTAAGSRFGEAGGAIGPSPAVNDPGDFDVNLQDASGEDAGTGVVQNTPEGVRVVVTPTGLEPGEYSVDIREGSCDSPGEVRAEAGTLEVTAGTASAIVELVEGASFEELGTDHVVAIYASNGGDEPVACGALEQDAG